MNEATATDPEPFIARTWRPLCIVTVVLYLTYEIAIEVDHRTSSKPFCGELKLANWVWWINFSQVGGLGVIVLMMLVRRLRDSSLTLPTRSAYNTVITCVSISFVTNTLTLTLDWGGVCMDVLGVQTAAAVWGEWLFCCPLLMFVVCTVDGRPHLTVLDWTSLACTFLSILFGFLIIVPQVVELAFFWLMMSCLTYAIVYPVMFDAKKQVSRLVRRPDQDCDEYERELELTTRKINIVSVFSYIMPSYTIVYFLAYMRNIDHNHTRALFLICDLLTKGMFAAYAMETHLELLHPAAMALVNEMRINEARRGFMKYIFHEVRVPLNSMTMGIEYLGRSENLDEEQKESLLMMQEASTFMGETLNEVLNMQKIEEGKLELEFNPFSLRDSIATVGRAFLAPLSKNEITLEIQIDTDFPNSITGDRSRIEHVMANFISNAIKFSPKGSRLILKATWRQILQALPSKKADITVSVIDNGMGISEENQKKLFTSFMQVRPGELQQGRGSGVGLAICRQLVVLHGGEVSCQSVLGQGSTFSFMIPMPYSSDEVSGSGEEKTVMTSTNRLNQVIPSAHRSGAYEGGLDDSSKRNKQSFTISTNILDDSIMDHSQATERNILDTKLPSNESSKLVRTSIDNLTLDGKILVVDDVMSNRKMLKLLLQKKGLSVDMAEDGRDAVAMVLMEPKSFYMIFMDNMMPFMSGVQATTALRQEGYEGLIIGLTGCAMDDDMAEYLNAGADLIVTKPINMSILENILCHVRDCGPNSVKGMKLGEVKGKLGWVPRA